jgi:hypothetical protein
MHLDCALPIFNEFHLLIYILKKKRKKKEYITEELTYLKQIDYISYLDCDNLDI